MSSQESAYICYNMQGRVILDSRKISLTIDRLCYQLIETHRNFQDTVIIGVQPRGVLLAARMHSRLQELLPNVSIPYGVLDFTFYRDDFRRTEKQHTPAKTDIPFSVEGKNVILIDDVLFTGRTIRSAMDALLDYGRPEDVELLVLIDRRLQRHLPIQAKYIGRTIDSIRSEKVKVNWKESDGEDSVWIIPSNQVIN
jgi:pyrimidine operon attenuation protein / uracil phosphoribosyltransferase